MYWTSATVPTTIPANFSMDTDFASFEDQNKNWKSVPGNNLKENCVAVSETTY